MKHLLTGVAIAAALAIAAPLSAQAAPMSPSGQSAAAKTTKTAAKTTQTAAKPRPHRAAHHAARSGHMRTASNGDKATRDLNLQELARIKGTAPAAHPMPAAAPHH